MFPLALIIISAFGDAFVIAQILPSSIYIYVGDFVDCLCGIDYPAVLNQYAFFHFSVPSYYSLKNILRPGQRKVNGKEGEDHGKCVKIERFTL